jgi:uncharacterized membrane protein
MGRGLGVVGVTALLACDATTPLPCEVDGVLAGKCRQCHNAELEFGATVPLVSWEDTQRPAPGDRARRVWHVMQERVHSPDRPMPPPGIGSLAADELAVFDAWFDAGAPPGAEPCD